MEEGKRPLKIFRTRNLDQLAFFLLQGISFELKAGKDDIFVYGEAPKTEAVLEAARSYRKNSMVPCQDFALAIRMIRLNVTRIKKN